MRNSKRTTALTESKLRHIIREAINNVLMNEAYSTGQWANLAGQAHQSTKTLSGKVRGLIDPKWRKRKERQRDIFARTAAAGKYGIHDDSITDKINHMYTYPDHKPNHTDYLQNHYMWDNPDDKRPFKLKRFSRDYDNNRSGVHNGELYNYDEIEQDDDMRDIIANNWELNHAYNSGRLAVNNKNAGTKGKLFKMYK